METDRERRNRNSYASSELASQGVLDGVAFRARESNGFTSSSSTSSPPVSPSASCSGVGSIEHRVSRMDTLAGIAIKYGVEVADIKRLNGLTTDLQMFAHEKLQIPLPGRHPPSPVMLNDSYSNRGQTPANRWRHGDVLESVQSLKLKPPRQTASPAMRILQGYYGLTPPRKPSASEGTDVANSSRGKSLNFVEKNFPRVSPVSEPPRQKPKKIVNRFPPGNFLPSEDTIVAGSAGNDESDILSSEKSVRRRQKTDADSVSIGDNPGKAGKNVGFRLKSASRTDLDSLNINPIVIRDSFMADGFISVRKSSSTSNLQESESSSMWPTTKWTLKPDAIAKPILDGLPKPLTSRRNKAALD